MYTKKTTKQFRFIKENSLWFSRKVLIMIQMKRNFLWFGIKDWSNIKERVIYNRGVGGLNTDEFLENINTLHLDLEPQKIVFLMQKFI